jgi:hypothetical protein
MPVGRPPIFKTAEEFEAAADLYFESCKPSGDDDGEIPTVNGLCLALGCCRDTLWEYAKKPAFSDAVKRARTRLEMAWEKRLAGTACTGAIFWLKNQGWSDKSEQVVTGDVTLTTLERRIVRPKD